MNQSSAPPDPEAPAVRRSRRSLPSALAALGVVLLGSVLWLYPRAAPEPAHEPSAPDAGPRDAPGEELAIEGFVHDDLGAPLARAVVHVRAVEQPELAPRELVTDVRGYFAAGGFARAPLLVSVTREGHVGDEQMIRPSDPLTLAFVLERQGELGIVLRDDPGRALEGAELVLTGPELWPPRSERANAQGEVVFKGLSAGTYSVRARKAERVAGPSPFVAVIPGERALQELALTPGETLTGTVIDRDTKRPLADVRLAVQDLTPGLLAIEAVSNAQGTFSLAGLWPVAVRLELRRDGYARGIEELKLPHREPLALTLRGAVTLRGRVVDERGKPVAHAAVTLATRDPQPLDLAPGANADGGVGELGVTAEVPDLPVRAVEGWELGELATYTDADGSFHIEGLPPVPLLLSVAQRGYASTTLPLRELAPHDTRGDLELVLRAAGTAEGRVLDARGEPVANVQVSGESSAGTLTASTDARGEFAFRDVLGELSVSAAPLGFVATHCHVTVLAGETARCELRIDSPLFTLAVRVVDEFGFALEGAEVTASFTLASARGKAQSSVTRLSGADGTASLGELPAPPYKLEVTLPGYVGVRELEVANGERELKVSLRRAATLTGVVLDALGQPVPSALVSSDGAENAETERDGSFTLVGVAPGALALRAAHPRAGSGTSAELRARPSESLSGIRIVLSGRYEPLAEAARGEEPPLEARTTDPTFTQRGQRVVVAQIAAGSAAARAGLHEGDVVEAIDGEPPLSAAHARGLLRDPAGKAATVRVLRERRRLSLRYKRPPL